MKAKDCDWKMKMCLIYVFLYMFVVASGVYGEVNISVKNIQRSLALEIFNGNFTKNAVVSALPIQFAFCKLASIAKGAAKTELLKSLGFKNDDTVENFYTIIRDMIDISRKTDLIIVNKIYLNYSDSINSNFLANSSVLYGVNVEKVSFKYPTAAASFANRGISLLTYKRIADVVESDDFKDPSSLVLVSGAHFKPTWEIQFDYSLTKPKTFHLLNKQLRQTPMMTKTDSFLYYDARDFKILTTRLGSMGCSMTFVLPTFVNLERFLDKLRADPELLKKNKKNMSWTQIKLMMPRMKIKNQFELTGYLKNMGLKEIFSSNSTGLNDILKPGLNGTNIFVSKVKQKLFFEVDEFGVVRMNQDWPDYRPKPRIPPSMIEFLLDRPFYFTVNFEQTPEDSFELFNGVFYEPQ